jgi:cysteine desulfuration protein SufE
MSSPAEWVWVLIPIAAIGIAPFKMWLRVKEKQIGAQSDLAAEKSAQYAQHMERFEALAMLGAPAMAGLPPLSEILEEYQLVDAEDRYRLLIDLGRQLEPMPDALKTDATKVRGCSASVWVYPTADNDGRLHFLADSNAAITKGVVALVLTAVQDKPAAEVAALDVAQALAPFELSKHLSANRTQGVPNMIALVKQTAERYAAA